ncbi:TPA: hypothetical protein R5E53_005100 [Enterobacter cloacae]|nr:hypothetical protein [Enterobacter cloacae]
MTANNPMTGEQLDELMTVAVNMQRDAETDCNRPSAMFAYAVQVAVLELRKVRNDYAALDQKLAESQRELRAADATIENMQMQVETLAAEECELNGDELKYVVEPSEFDALTDLLDETPATDSFLAEVRASATPEGYVLVPQEMHLSSEAMEGICFHCGDGDHNFGEFTDGTLFVGEVDYGDGKKVHGLHIATADYPEEGCTTICEFAAQLRKGVQS